MAKAPKVSVITITYNHEDYIGQAIESIVSQKVKFNFEFIIADDASTDRTPEIIASYARKYPDVIKPILRKKNIGAQNNFKDAISKAAGEYIALCEGDDYWISSYKLQKQADFLDAKKEYSLVFHPVRVIYEDKKNDDTVYPSPDRSHDFTLEGLLRENFIQTNSVLYRKQDYSELPTDILPLDWYLHLYHAQFGDIGFIDSVMSVYRRHSGGMWWDSHGNPGEIWKKYGVNYLGLFVEIMNLYRTNSEYKMIIKPSIVNMFNRLLQADKDNGLHMIDAAVTKYPEAASFFIKEQNESIQKIDSIKNEREAATYRLSVDLSRAMEEVMQVKSSRSFLLGYYVSHPWKAPKFLAKQIRSVIHVMRTSMKNRIELAKSEDGYKEMKAKLAKYRNRNRKKIAVILHLYYTDLWGYFCKRLDQLDQSDFDLFVSLPAGSEDFEQRIREVYTDACVVISPNRGRDVLSFLIIAKSIRRKGYNTVLKIHSKKSKHRTDGDMWLSSIVDNLLPDTPEAIGLILETLRKPDTGIVGPEGQYVSLAVNYEANKANIRQTLRELKSSKIKEGVDSHRFDYGFFAGTMFWARLDAIDSILTKNTSAALFNMETGQIDSTYAHAIERILCLIPELDGKKVYSVGKYGIRETEYSSGIIPEWSDVYIGQKR